MGWPQITILILVCISIGISLAKHGEPKDGNYSIWTELISNAIVLGLLYAGGFFG